MDDNEKPDDDERSDEEDLEEEFESQRLTFKECASTKLTKSLSSGSRQGLFLVMRLPRASSAAMPKRASVTWTLRKEKFFF